MARAFTDEDMAYILSNPDKVRAEVSLIEFTKQAWPILEPGNPFVTGWAVECMAEHLQYVTEGHITRLLINVPPGLSKSTLVNVFWPAWEWGPFGRSDYRYISASYERGLAVRDMGRCRDLIEDEWFQARWPIQFKPDQNEKTLYQNLNTGWRLAASVGGRLTGFRGDRIIIDDPINPEQAESEPLRNRALRWQTETVSSRYNHQKEWTDTKGRPQPRSAQVIIMQRLHEHDPSGMVIEHLMDADDWVTLILPMEFETKNRAYSIVPPARDDVLPQRMRRVKDDDDPLPHYVEDPNGDLMYAQDPRTEEGQLLFPERYDEKATSALKANLRAHGGTYAEASQLQQRPTVRGGGKFKRKDFKLWEGAIPEHRRIVRGWDLAASKSSRSAFTAGVRMSKLLDGSGRILIEDSTRERLTPFDVEELILACCNGDGIQCYTSIPQDPGAAGVAWKDHMAAKLAGHDIHFSPETGDKDFRANPFAAAVEAGLVYLVPGSWNAVYLSEAAAFSPGAAYKDQIDASSRAYAVLAKDVDAEVSHFGPRLIR